MRVLFVENEDSFSWNVIDALPCRRREVVVRSGRDAAADESALAGADVVVIGPGPTDPLRAGIVGIVHAAARSRCPLLGICLGHQALGIAYGAELLRHRPVHGAQSAVCFGASRLFPSFRGVETVMRYHSLALGAVSAPLRVIATLDDGTPMAIEHERLPLAGLQFHPDSYGTPRGREMIADFFEAVR